MKPKEIQDLIDFISNSGLEEVNIETSEFKIRVKRSAKATSVVESTPTAVFTAPAPAPPAIPAPSQNPTPVAVDSESGDEGKYVTIKSPMIGTFYRSQNPESEVFANVGDKVSVGKTVCIIEAMKLFNEIESEVSGTVIKVLVDNAQPVEYDQPLFLIDPS